MKTTLKYTALLTLRWFAFIAVCISMLVLVSVLVGKGPQRLGGTPPPAGQCHAGTFDMSQLFRAR